MAIGNVELMHKCFPKHSRMGTERMKYDKETERNNKRGVSIERSKEEGLSLPYQNILLINIIW